MGPLEALRLRRRDETHDLESVGKAVVSKAVEGDRTEPTTPVASGEVTLLSNNGMASDPQEESQTDITTTAEEVSATQPQTAPVKGLEKLSRKQLENRLATNERHFKILKEEREALLKQYMIVAARDNVDTNPKSNGHKPTPKS